MKILKRLEIRQCIGIALAIMAPPILRHFHVAADLMPFGFIATTAALIAAGIGAAGSVAGAAIGAHAAGSAADAQAAAADQIKQQALDAAKTATSTVNTGADTAIANVNAATGAADTDISGASDKLNTAKDQQLQALQPYVDAGKLSLADVQQILGVGGALGPDAKQFSFTPQDYQNDPQYAFIRDQANAALARSAAARGGLFTGGFAKATGRLNTNLTNTFLDSAFNRVKATYDTNRSAALQRLTGLTNLTNLGYSATGVENQDIGNTASQVNANDVNIANNKLVAGRYAGDTGFAASQYAGNTGLTAAQIAANALGAKANAQAAGDIGTATAINQGIGGVINAANRAAVVYSLPKTTGSTLPVGTNTGTNRGMI